MTTTAEQKRAWWNRNKKRLRKSGTQRMRAWRERNPERDRANWKRWQALNRARLNAKRRARRRASGYTEKDRQEKRRYYVRHSEELKKKNLARYYATAKGSAKYKERRAKHRANLLRWRREHPKETLAAVQRYIKKHPEKMRQRYHARYIREMGWKVRGSHTVGQWLARCAFYGWKCVYCGTPLTRKTVTKDHRIPVSKGGTDFASNLVPACRSCNSRKGNR